MGKSHVLKRLKRGIGRYILLQDSTRVGLLDTLREHPKATVLSDDNDGMWTDIPTLNVLKAALAERNARVLHVNRASLRAGSHDIIFSGRIASASNHEPANLSARYSPHFQAIASRSTVIQLTRNPLDLLEFIDWRVCEDNHFRSDQFFKDTGITSLGLAAAQDVLDFVHHYAWRFQSIDLRRLNSIAVERKRDPEGWADRCIALHVEQPVGVVAGRPPPSPLVQRWTERRNSAVQARASMPSGSAYGSQSVQGGADAAQKAEPLTDTRPIGEPSDCAVGLTTLAAPRSTGDDTDVNGDQVFPTDVRDELPSGMSEASSGQDAAVGRGEPLRASAAEAAKLAATDLPATSVLAASSLRSPEQEQEPRQRPGQTEPPQLDGHVSAGSASFSARHESGHHL